MAMEGAIPTQTKAKATSKPRMSRTELRAMGKELRTKHPRTSHAAWRAPANRPDPLELLKESSKGRIPELLPIRFGRMLKSPFTFYRGAALNWRSRTSRSPTPIRASATTRAS